MAKNKFLDISKTAAQHSLDKKGKDVLLLNVRRLTTVTDYFLIVTADSPPQIKAIRETIQKAVSEKYDIKPVHKEGDHHSNWSVIDYGGLVVHIMLEDARDFYAIERIWDGARKIKV